MPKFKDEDRVKVIKGHQARSMNWVEEGKVGTVKSSVDSGTLGRRVTYYNVKFDDGTREPAIAEDKLALAD